MLASEFDARLDLWKQRTNDAGVPRDVTFYVKCPQRGIDVIIMTPL